MAPDGEKPSIESTMAAVFDKIDTEEKTARAAEAAEVAEPVETPEAQTQEAPEGETAEQKAERLRAEDGKFRAPTRAEKKAAKATRDNAGKTPEVPGDAGAKALAPAPKTPQAEAAPTEAAPAAKQTPDQNPIGLAGVNPPAGWSAAAKAAFASLPPAVQAAVSRREQEVAQGFAQYEGIGKALAPMQPMLQARGVAPAAYVQQMVAIDQALQNPATRNQAFAYLFQTYGYRPGASSADQQHGGASNPLMQPSADPTIAALQQQLQLVTSHLTQQEAQRAAELNHVQQETQRQANADVEAFRNDPANEFFDLVRDDIRGVYERAAVLQQKAPTLKEAYEQAVWANAQTRPVMLARQAQKESDARAKAAADAAAKARKSTPPNLRGTNGHTPNTGPKRPIEEEMAEVYDKLHA